MYGTTPSHTTINVWCADLAATQCHGNGIFCIPNLTRRLYRRRRRRRLQRRRTRLLFHEGTDAQTDMHFNVEIIQRFADWFLSSFFFLVCSSAGCIIIITSRRGCFYRKKLPLIKTTESIDFRCDKAAYACKNPTHAISWCTVPKEKKCN